MIFGWSAKQKILAARVDALECAIWLAKAADEIERLKGDADLVARIRRVAARHELEYNR